MGGRRSNGWDRLFLRGGGAWEVPKYAWDQTRDLVKLYVFLDGVESAWGGDWEEHVAVKFGPMSVEVSVDDLTGSDGVAHSYKLALSLFSPITPEKSTFALKTDRISISLSKETLGGLWPKLTRVTSLTIDDIPTLPEGFRRPIQDAGTPVSKQGEGEGEEGEAAWRNKDSASKMAGV